MTRILETTNSKKRNKNPGGVGREARQGKKSPRCNGG